MSTTKTIYLIRHGETEYNRLGMVQGSGIDSELNEAGLRQSELFFRSYGHIPFDKVYTSSLKRTWQSVSPFLEKGIEHVILPELNEISWGDYEGKLSNLDWKADYYRIIEAWGKGELHHTVPNGESPLELAARQQRAIDMLLADRHVSNALVCMHGRAMKSFLCLLLNKPLTCMEEFSHANLCLYQLEHHQEAFRIVKANDTDHLSSLKVEV